MRKMGGAMQFQLEEIVARIGALLDGDGSLLITGVNSLELAGPEEITFAEDIRLAEKVAAGQAGAVLVAEDFPSMPDRNLLRTAEPRVAFFRIMELFAPQPEPSGIHLDASIAPDAELAEDVSVGACAVISSGASIGARTIVDPGAYVGPGVVIGEGCHIEPNAVLMQGVSLGNRVIIHAGATIGGDGFGYFWLKDHHHKIPQLGKVQIDDDVEIGCNSCVDCATLGVTRIRRGTKIDNQVQIAHNNDIGEDVIFVGHSGTAGSVTVGQGTMVGGKAGIADHVEVGAGARIGAATGVTCDIDAGETVWGVPSRPIKRVLKEQASVARLPEMMKAFRKQSKELEDLKQRLELLEKTS